MKPRIALALLLACFTLGPATAQEQSGQANFVYGVRGYSDSSPFKSPQGIFFDRWQKEIYICDSGNHQVVIFDSTGFPLYRFDHWLKRSGEEERILGEPRNLVVSKAGDIFLVDNLIGYVDILDQRGSSVDKLVLQEIPEFEDVKIRPEFLAIDDEDNLYMATSGEKVKILIFDENLNLIKHFGVKGQNEGELKIITGLWADEDGKIYVTDADAAFCVQVFSPEGELLLGFGGHGIEKEDFSLPTGVVTGADGKIFVADELRQVVKAFDREGNFLFWFGGFGVSGGAMRYPRHIAGDGREQVFVLERVGGRYQKFLLGRD